MVGLVITGIISVGIMRLLSDSIATQRVIQNREAAMALQLYALGLLSDPQICAASFRNYNVQTGANPVSRIRSATTDLIAPNDLFEAGAVRVVSVRFDPTVPQFAFRPYFAAPDPGQYKGSMTLLITVEGQGVPSTTPLMTRTVQVIVQLKGFTGLAPAMEIDSCVAVGNSVDNIWKYALNNIDIYYPQGKVGIGVAAPLRELHVNGDVLANAYYYTSDLRLKEDLRVLPGLQGIEQLHGYRFRWKKDGQESFGLIAQEVEKAYPEAVYTDPGSGLKMVNYSQLIAPLVEGMKELSEENRDLKRRLRRLEKQSQQ